MFACNACFRRLLHNLTFPESSLRIPQGSRARFVRVLAAHQSTGTARGSSGSRTSLPQSPRQRARGTPDHNGSSIKQARIGNEALAAKKSVEASEEDDDAFEDVDTQKKVLQQKKNLQTEMKWLQDPMRLAERIKTILDKDGDVEKALVLVRMTNRSASYTVSWNHIIDWQMTQGKTKAAFKTYNELKKRAQRPDSYTYLLLLRGLAAHANYPNSLGRALSIYHSMYAPNSHAYPTIRHSNAVLTVCANAKDKESIWDISSRLPDQGPQSADRLTYTILLNSLRERASEQIGPGGPVSEQMGAKKEEAIREGRNLWAIIVQRWREAQLALDEGLVLAMGRLLLIGRRPKDWDDVFSVVHQTMNIPRLAKRLGTPSKPTPGWGSTQNLLGDSSSTEDSSEVKFKPGAEFAPFGKAQFKMPKAGETTHVDKSLVHAPATPTNKTLTLLLDACTLLPGKSTAQDYWALLTDKNGWNITPDAASIHAYLRVLRLQRQSSDALDVVKEEMPRFGVKPQPKTFVLAMSACRRDANSAKAARSATSLIELMTEKLDMPDMKVVQAYLAMAVKHEDLQFKIDVLKAVLPISQKMIPLISIEEEGHQQSRPNHDADQAVDDTEMKGLRSRGEDHRIKHKNDDLRDPSALAIVNRILGLHQQILRPKQQADGKADLSELHKLLSEEQIAEISSSRQKLQAQVTAQMQSQSRRKMNRAGSTSTEQKVAMDTRDTSHRRERGYNPGKRERAEARQRKSGKPLWPWGE